MPLERPEPRPTGAIEPPRTHQEGQRWSTRFAGEKPIPLGTAGGYIYARDLNTGELTTAPAEGPERYKREKAVRYLDEYGEHEGSAFTLTHPWDMLLRYGGAKEFPLSQVLAHNWQRFPPEIDGEVIAFPQLEGKTFENVDCPFCFKAMPSDLGLRKHITVMHADRVAADDLATGVTKGMTAALAANRGEPEEWKKTKLPFVCGACGGDFDNIVTFKKHVESHEAVAAT